jgi:hypothetical protein
MGRYWIHIQTIHVEQPVIPVNTCPTEQGRKWKGAVIMYYIYAEEKCMESNKKKERPVYL